MWISLCLVRFLLSNDCRLFGLWVFDVLCLWDVCLRGAVIQEKIYKQDLCMMIEKGVVV